jgi:hypothetical protein
MTNQNDRELFLLVFYVRRISMKKWYQFWLRTYAKVIAHVYAEDVKNAKAIAENDIRRKGFHISKYIEINKFEDIGYPAEVMHELEESLKKRTRYAFTGLLDSEKKVIEGKSKIDPNNIPSRYADYDGVQIDLRKVPRDLHIIVPYAKKWAICDDVERIEYRNQVSSKDTDEFYRVVASKVEAIEAYCDLHREEIPVPDEVVLFDLMLEAFAEISPGIGYVDELGN